MKKLIIILLSIFAIVVVDSSIAEPNECDPSANGGNNGNKCNKKTKWRLLSNEETEEIIRERKKNLLQRLGQVCLWCFAYSKRKTLDCLRRPIVGRFIFLQQHMCLV